MKRMVVLGTCLLLPLLGFSAEEPSIPPSQPSTTTTERHVIAREVTLKIDPLSDEQLQAGLTVDLIREAMVQQLQEADISVNETISQPSLELKVRTIVVGFDMASFFQLSLHEEAMLVRNRSKFNAATWSQVSLLSCRPEDLKKEALETVSMMSRSFAHDFAKALQPTSK